jgi:hypothetical protein
MHFSSLPALSLDRALRVALAATLTSLLIGALLPRTAQAQAPSDKQAQPSFDKEAFVGSWVGLLETDLTKLRFAVRIERADDSTLTATLISPDGSGDIPVSHFAVRGDSLTLKAESIGGQFAGVLAADSSAIEGTWTQRGQSIPIMLRPSAQSPNRVALDDYFSEPFRGITTDGEPAPGLFPIRATGVSTAPVVEAADAFLSTLTPEQRAKTTFPTSSIEWRHWTFTPLLDRRGVSLGEMSEAQRDAAFALMQAGLSAKGFELARDILRIRNYVANLSNRYTPESYPELPHHMTLMGDPSAAEPWGWQLDGHHMVINYFVLGDQVVMTPTFFGSAPAVVDTGQYAGTEVLQKEQDEGLALMQSLRPNQRRQARIADEKTEENMRALPFHDNLELDYAGINVDRLDAAQRDRLLELIRLYVGNIKEEHARVRMSEVRRHLDETYFAWIGGTGAGEVFYYRIHSPVLLIEFDHALRRTMPGEPGLTRDHIHTVVRTPNGNDYGKSLLHQHYEATRADSTHQHHE